MHALGMHRQAADNPVTIVLQFSNLHACDCYSGAHMHSVYAIAVLYESTVQTNVDIQ